MPRTEIEETDEKDNIMIIEEASTSTHDFGKSVPSTSSLKNQNFVEFPDDDFDFDDDDIIMKTNESERFPIHASVFIIFDIYLSYLLFAFSVVKIKIL